MSVSWHRYPGAGPRLVASAECYIIMEFPPPARLQQLQSSRATDFPRIVTQRRGRASTRGSVTGREWRDQHRYPGHLSFSRPTLAHCLAACLAHCSAWPQHSSPHTFGFTMRPLRPDVERRINYQCATEELFYFCLG